MKARIFYRIAAVLILLLDAGHTLGFPWSDPEWKVDLAPMQSTHFQILGFSRTYWDFYIGFGLTITVFLLLAAVMAWQLGSLSPEMMSRLSATRWVLPICFAATTVLNWRYFFTIPIVFSSVITLFLIVAAWRSGKSV